jgi:hypothetical protein
MIKYKLTKTQLEESAYYCGAGIDLQPLLRFGDVISDFVYVTFDLKEKEFVDSIEEYLRRLALLLNPKCSLKLVQVENLLITDIEHNQRGRLLYGKPEYLNDNQYRNLVQSTTARRNDIEDFHKILTFELRIGSSVKTLRVFNLTGEALATYQVLYVNQNIAPKIFISIQTGLIERPHYFSNAMFESHQVRPKVWIRGFWYSTENWGNYFDINEVFSTTGVYNKIIGEFMNWDAHMGIDLHALGVTSRHYPDRLVKAFGEKKEWEKYTLEDKVFKNENLIIRFTFQRFVNSPQIQNSGAVILRNNAENNFFLDDVYNKYLETSSNNNINNYNVIVIPYGYECQLLYTDEFVRNFVPVNNTKLIIDVYFAYSFDFIRVL